MFVPKKHILWSIWSYVYCSMLFLLLWLKLFFVPYWLSFLVIDSIHTQSILSEFKQTTNYWFFFSKNKTAFFPPVIVWPWVVKHFSIINIKGVPVIMIMLMKVTFLYITYLIYNLLQLHILSLETVVTSSALKIGNFYDLACSMKKIIPRECLF